MNKILSLTMLVFCVKMVFSQKILTLQDSLAATFKEVKEATKKEISLWNVDLYGPILLVNPGTREVYSNSPDSGKLLQQTGSIYIGKLPFNINIANTFINWSGNNWAMVMLPLPTNKNDRINLLAHELFHKSQAYLNLKIVNTDNNHLDAMNGRIYLRLELEALKKAINSSDPGQIKSFLTDAFTFRKYRQSIYPGADTTENILELNEGLAEYTGQIISGRTRKQSIDHFNEAVTNFLLTPTFVRSFAYQTIPLYGYLLRDRQIFWNKSITQKTLLTDYFIKAFNISLSSTLKKSAEKKAMGYNVAALIIEETSRQERIKKLIVEYKKKFIEQAHFEITFEQMNISFDPGNIMPIEDKGTIYPNIRISDKWGILSVANGALMSPDWDKISLSLPLKIEGKNVRGEGWNLSLNEGYSVIENAHNGNFILIKK